jgi:hypothetical protein
VHSDVTKDILWLGNFLPAVILDKWTWTYQHGRTWRKAVSIVSAFIDPNFPHNFPFFVIWFTLRKKESCFVKRRMSVQSWYWSHPLFTWLHKLKYVHCTAVVNQLHIFRYKRGWYMFTQFHKRRLSNLRSWYSDQATDWTTWESEFDFPLGRRYLFTAVFPGCGAHRTSCPKCNWNLPSGL